MTLIFAYQNRGLTRDLTINDADGAAVTFDSHDKVRVRIGREGETAKFSVTSGSPTTNGSSLTAANPTRLRMDAADLSFDPGAYTMFVEYYDHSDAQEWKEVSRQVFVLEGT